MFAITKSLIKNFNYNLAIKKDIASVLQEQVGETYTLSIYLNIF